MIEGVKAADQYLYHYTKMSTALDYIFKYKSFRFGRYLETNDPKETKAWEFSLGTNANRDLAEYNMTELSAWLSGELKQKARVACFSMDTGPLSGNHLDDIFRRGFSKPRMWAQYAYKHTGACLVFDRAKLLRLIDAQFGAHLRVLSGPVSYRDRSVVPSLRDQTYMINIDALEALGRNQYALAHLQTHYGRLFFEKMQDWRDESEWRWIIWSDSPDDVLLSLEDSIAGVMFGENSDEISIQAVIDLTGSWGIRWMGLKWKNCSPWYDYGNMRYLRVLRGEH